MQKYVSYYVMLQQDKLDCIYVLNNVRSEYADIEDYRI